MLVHSRVSSENPEICIPNTRLFWEHSLPVQVFVCRRLCVCGPPNNSFLTSQSRHYKSKSKNRMRHEAKNKLMKNWFRICVDLCLATTRSASIIDRHGYDFMQIKDNEQVFCPLAILPVHRSENVIVADSKAWILCGFPRRSRGSS